MELFYHIDSPVGGLTMTSDGTALTGLWFDKQPYAGGVSSLRQEEARLPIFDETARWLACYFKGQEPQFTPALKLNATPFRQAVWKILQTIPYGQTVTYGDIAANIAKQQGILRMSAQAVGGAVGQNPIAIIIPCHRVIGANGNLTGYAGGMEKKIALLQLEGVTMEKLWVPQKKQPLSKSEAKGEQDAIRF